MTLPATIDPRLHDAVIFGFDGAVTGTASIEALPNRLPCNTFRPRGIGNHLNVTGGPAVG